MASGGAAIDRIGWNASGLERLVNAHFARRRRGPHDSANGNKLASSRVTVLLVSNSRPAASSMTP